jgi:sugar (pentulose or hexulose) kinase
VTELLLGLDIGTSSSKAVLARPDGTVVASAERAHELSLPRPGWAEHDAAAVWWDDVRALCAGLVPQAGGRVAGVCVSGIGPCVVPCDAALRPLRPAILYGIDTRAEAEVAELSERYGAERIVARGGSMLSSQALGGGLWTQIVSDACGLEQQIPRQTIGASYGDALMAAIGAGLVAPDTDWTETAEVIEPDDAARDVYDELFDLYLELYPATAEIAHRLAALQERAAAPLGARGA